MNDHNDSEHFAYNKSWEDIENMLLQAERKQNMHYSQLQRKKLSKKDKLMHMRNYKALEGVIKSLRWVLGDLKIQHPLE